MEPNKISNFGILSLLTDEKKSALDCLMPIIEYGLKECQKNSYSETERLRQDIREQCLIDIPTRTVVTLLKRLRREGKIEGYEGYRTFRIIGDFSVIAGEYEEKLAAFSREIRKFIGLCKEYSHLEASDEEIAGVLYKFISKYQHSIDTAQDRFVLDESDPEDLFQGVVAFIEHIMLKDESTYAIFKNVFYGYILTQFISRSKDTPDFRKVSDLTVFVDTDFLLRLLDLQAPYFTTTAKELLILMKDSGIRVQVLPEVIDETKAVLNHHLRYYISHKDEISETYGSLAARFADIDGAFYRLQLSISEIQDLIDSLEQRVSELGIVLAGSIPSSLKINQEEYERIVEYKLRKYEHDSDEDKQRAEQRIRERVKLDAMLLEHVRLLRRHRVQRFQDAKYLLLTCDNSIYRTSQKTHKDGTIEECMNETTLTNTLFLCNPTQKGEIPINLLLSMFKSSDYLDYGMFRRFNHAIQRYLQDEPNEKDYVSKVYSNQRLFNNINETYGTDDVDETVETQFLKDLFRQARENAESDKRIVELAKQKIKEQKVRIDSAETGLDEAKRVTIEQTKQLKRAEKENRELRDKNAEQEELVMQKAHDLDAAEKRATDANERLKQYQERTERTIRTGILCTLFFLLILSLVLFLLYLCYHIYNSMEEWYTNPYMWAGLMPIVFLGSMYVQVGEKENIEAIVHHYTLKAENEIIWPLILRLVIKSIGYAVISYAIPIFVKLVRYNN